jgi:anti-sigma factor RsiW
MPVTDQELEQLETHLDEALEPSERSALEARLAHDPEVAAALETLQAQRAMVLSYFNTLEPDDAATQALAASICESAFAMPARSTPTRAWRWYGAAAACLLVGFLTGQFVRLHPAAKPQSAANMPIAVSTQPGGAKVEAIVTYQVALTDEAGHVTAVQNFDSLEQAQNFARDVSRWQDRHADLQTRGKPVVVADRF